MDWIKVTIKTDNIEITVGALISIGINEFEIIEKYEDVCSELNKQVKYWDFIDEEKIKNHNDEEKIIVYIKDNEFAKDKLNQLTTKLFEVNNLGIVNSRIDLDSLKDEDWVNNWRKYFKPIEIGENIVISPVWEEKEYKGKTVLKIDPGMIFGTGGHETTQLCIEQIEKHLEKGDRILDLGCGSGILSIIAMLLGANSALGIDIDPAAKKYVEQNAKMNMVTNIDTIIGDLLCDKDLIDMLSKEQFDFVAANIIADVIIQILPLVNSCLKKGGYFICSGIIDDRIEDVNKALIDNGFEIQEKHIKGEWAVFLSKRG